MEITEYAQSSDEHMRAISPKDSVSLLSLALNNTMAHASREFDIDPTPRPLCIVKRRSVRTPHAIRSSQPSSLPTAGNSPSRRPSISAPIPIPRRRSSTAFPRVRNAPKEVTISDSSFGSGIQSHMSNSSFSTAIMSPSGGRFKGDEDLKVRKRRGKSKSCTNTEPMRDINDFYPPQFLSSSSESERLSCHSNNHKVSSKYTTPPSRIVSGNEDTQKVIPTFSRDVSVGTFLKSELLNPLTAIDPSRTLADQGAFSDSEGISERSTELDPERYDVSLRTADGYDLVNDNAMQAFRLSRRPNVGLELPTKKKIFSRVLSGFSLLGRSSSIIGIRNGNVQVKRASSVPRRQRGNEALRSSSGTEAPSLKSTSTLVSSNQETLSGSESTNMASPRPFDLGFATSPTNIDALATEHTELYALTRPQIAPLLQASLIVTPELESVDTEGSQSFWVAVEVTGDVRIPPLSYPASAPRKKGLDVILLVDLSVNTSTATFMSSRDICSSVSSLLDPHADRLAILTSYANSSRLHKIHKAHVLFPFRPPNPKHVLDALDTMTGPNNSVAHSDANLGHAIKVAFNLFSSSKPLDLRIVDRDLAAGINGHLFLISEDPPKNIDRPERCEAIQIHLVNPSTIPWMGTQGIINGWQLDSNFSESSSSANSGGLSSRLNAIVEHARFGNSPGKLKDLVIDMKPMSNCEVEAIMGETKHQRLNPGQRVLVFAKLHVGPYSLLRPPATVFGPQDRGVQTSMHLLEQLDAILGQAKTEILTVEVKYKHSLFSTDTNISITSIARLRRHAQQSSWNPQSNSQLSGSCDNSQSRVRRHLIHFIAGSHSPLQALSTLEDMFGETSAPLGCPAYFEQLRRELKHRVWISDRPDRLQNEVSSHGNSGLASPIDHSKTSSDRLNTTTRTQHFGSAVVNKRLVRIPSKESVDEARRIWVEMRKKARGRESIQELSGYMPVSDENLMKIAEKALSNKRSLGADTLKSIATGRRKSGLFAPWL